MIFNLILQNSFQKKFL